ncbi:MAG: hypothetical protein AAF846_11170 [Chloroflexota bacterium]
MSEVIGIKKRQARKEAKLAIVSVLKGEHYDFLDDEFGEVDAKKIKNEIEWLIEKMESENKKLKS